MKPNSKTRASAFFEAIPINKPEGGTAITRRLAREFRAVRRQARRGALLSAAAEIERLRAACVGVNDYELGLATALEAVREMAAPKRRKPPG